MNVIHNDEGARRVLFEYLSKLGYLPKHSLFLLAENGKNLQVLQRQLNRMEKEGYVETYKENTHKGKLNCWIQKLVLNKDTEKVLEGFKSQKETKELKERILPRVNDLFQNKREPQRKMRSLDNTETALFYLSAGYSYMPEEKSLQSISFKRKTYVDSYQLKGKATLKSGVDTAEIYSPENRDENSGIPTRLNGVIVMNESYSVFRTDRHFFKISEKGEFKAKAHINSVLSEKNLPLVKSVILLSKNEDFVGELLTREDLSRNLIAVLKDHYESIFYIPYDLNGRMITKIMEIPDWRIKVKSLTLPFEEVKAAEGCGVVCDGYRIENNTSEYTLLFCIPDIKKLNSFLLNAEADESNSKYQIMCFDCQKEMITKIAGKRCKVLSTPISSFMEMMEE